MQGITVKIAVKQPIKTVLRQNVIQVSVGKTGSAGREVELESDGTNVRWRYAGEPVWYDLVAIADLQGATGPAGPTGATGAPVAGMTANAIGITGDALWASESAILNGRYIYSLRGGATATIDRFDIAGGTAGAGAWAAVTYIGTETFTTGSSAFPMGEFLYIRKDATNRFFKYSVVDNAMRPFATNLYPDGAALLGHKIWVKNLAGSDIKWLYSLMNTGTVLHRVMII